MFRDAYTQEHEIIYPCVGSTVAESLAGINLDTALIVANGNKVESDYIIKEGDVIGLRIFPKETFTATMAVISAVLLIASLAVGVGVAIAYNVSPAFRSWLKGLFAKDADTDTKGEDLPYISGQSNQSAKNTAIPLVLGKRLLTPRYIGKPFTRPKGVYGEKQDMYVLYMLGYSDMEVRNIKLKYIDLATNNDNVTGKEKSLTERLIKIDSTYFNKAKDTSFIELCNGQKSELYPQRVIQESWGVQIQNVATVGELPVDKNSATNPMAIEMEVGFDGLYQMDGTDRKVAYVDLKFEYRTGGSSGYSCERVIPNNIDYSMRFDNYTAEYVQVWQDAHPDYIDDNGKKHRFIVTGYTYKVSGSGVDYYMEYSEAIYSKSEWAPFYITPRTEYGLAIANDTESGITRIASTLNQTMRFVARKEFTVDEIKGMLPTESAEENFVYMRVTRMNQESISTQVCDKAFLINTRTECFDFDATKKAYENGSLSGNARPIPQYPINNEFVLNNTMVIALKLEANEGIKDSVDAFNCVLQTKAPIYNSDSGWSTTEYPTSNPASLVYKLMSHPMLKNSKYNIEKSFDREQLGAFYDYCKNSQFECNAIYTQQLKLGDAIRQILECGHAFLIPSESGYSIFMDNAREDTQGDITPDAILNSHNILSDGLSNSKEFSELPDGLEIKFVDADANYTESSIRCYYDNSIAGDNARLAKAKIETVKYPNVTSGMQAWRLGKYNLLKMYLRPEIWQRKDSFNGEVINIGSYVEIQDDTLSVGIGEGGTVVGIIGSKGYVTGFRTDSGLEITDTSKRYGAKFIHYKDSYEPKSYTYELEINEKGYFKEFTLVEPVLEEDFLLTEGDVVSFGEFDKITTGALCIAKTRNEDNTFNLSLVPYDKDIYYYDIPNRDFGDPYLPSFKPKMTSNEGLTTPAEVPTNDVTQNDLVYIEQRVNKYTDKKVEEIELKPSPRYETIIDTAVIKKLSESSYSPPAVKCNSYKTTFDDDGNATQLPHVSSWEVTINGQYDLGYEPSSSLNLDIQKIIEQVKIAQGLSSLELKSIRIVSKTENAGVILDDEYIPVLSSDGGYMLELENDYQVFECYSKVDGIDYPSGYIKKENTIRVIPHFYNGLQLLNYGTDWLYSVIPSVEGFRIEIESTARASDGVLKITALEGADMATEGSIPIPVFIRSSTNKQIAIGYEQDGVEYGIGFIDADGNENQIGYIEAEEDSGIVVKSFGYKKLTETAVRLAESDTFIEDISKDNKVTAPEKKLLYMQFEQVQADYDKYTAVYSACVSYENYAGAYNALKKILDVLFVDMTKTSNVDRNVFNDSWTAYYNAKASLENEISQNPVYSKISSVEELSELEPKYGDYILWAGNDEGIFQRGLVYTYYGFGKGWIEDNSPEKMMVAMDDSLSLLANVDDDSIPSVVFCKKLIAMNAVIKNLASQVITLQQGGEIRSTTGNLSIKADGTANFNGTTNIGGNLNVNGNANIRGSGYIGSDKAIKFNSDGSVDIGGNARFGMDAQFQGVVKTPNAKNIRYEQFMNMTADDLEGYYFRGSDYNPYISYIRDIYMGFLVLDNLDVNKVSPFMTSPEYVFQNVQGWVNICFTISQKFLDEDGKFGNVANLKQSTWNYYKGSGNLVIRPNSGDYAVYAINGICCYAESATLRWQIKCLTTDNLDIQVVGTYSNKGAEYVVKRGGTVIIPKTGVDDISLDFRIF